MRPSNRRKTAGTILFCVCFGVLSWVGGCASLSRSECLYADLYTIGYEDGLQGLQAQRIADHRQACAAYGIVPDLDRYTQGRDAGLKHFCTTSNGLALGRSGGSYGQVCPSDNQAEFLAGYQLGLEIYQLDYALRRQENEIRQAEDELAKEGLNDEERQLLTSRLRSLEREYGRLETELEHLEQEADRLVF